MAKEKNSIRDELRSYKLEFDLLKEVPCSEQENKEYQNRLKERGDLPEGVFAYVYSNGAISTTEFYTIQETDLTTAEIKEYLMYKKIKFLKTIKNCVVFFTILTIISMIACFIILSNAM